MLRPPPPPRRQSPVIRIQDYSYGTEERRKDPITNSRRTGKKTRVTVSSAQDAYQGAGDSYLPIARPIREPYPTRRRNYRNSDYRRYRSRSSSQNSRGPRRRSSSHANDPYDDAHPRRTWRDSRESNGFSDTDDVSTLEFEFDLADSLNSGNKSQVSSAALESPSSKTGHVPVAGPTADLYLAGSRWLGNTFDNWDLSAELTTVPVSPHAQHLMNWHHMERPMPTFDEFIAVCRRVLQQIPERNMRRIEEMLHKIQKENDKQRQYGRELVPICISDAEYENNGTDDKQNFSACFSAFPFFSLEKLVEVRPRSSTPNTSYHPSRPLLQTYTRTVSEKRELSQVITARPSTPKGQCLHVSFVWCLLVNDDTIITCSKMGMEELRKDFTSIRSQPQSASTKTVRVKSGNTRSWSFPAEELRSWPSLLAMFADDFSAIGDRDANATITHHGRVVNAKTWPQIVARTIRFPVELVLQDGKDDNESGLRSKLQAIKDVFKPSATSRVPGPNVSTSADGAIEDGADGPEVATKDEIVNRLRAIPSLNIFQRDSIVSSKPLFRLADALHETLETHLQKTALEAYSTCPTATIEDVQAELSQGMVTSGSNTNRRVHTVVHGKFERIALLAEYTFALFWPIDCDHIMTRRFWGALHALLDSGGARRAGNTDSRRSAEMAAEFYDVLYHRVFAVASALTTSFTGSDIPLLTSFPNQFYEAWLHLISAFVLVSEFRPKDSPHNSWRLPVQQLKMAASRLEAGGEELVNRLRRVEVEEYEVCSSRGIVALMFNRLSRDVMRDVPEVAQTYSDYCQQLDAKVLENPLFRTHQASIRSLQQELEAVLSTLTQQLDVFNAFERSIQAQDGDRRAPYLPPLLNSRQDAILETCKNTLAARIDQFKALQARVTELGEWHLGEIDNHKDRQEAAIMVFTIITIIFLPLSFVSSVFGMNTSDIRDMEFGQWLYWAVAIPLTIVVIAGSLYWAGALGDCQAWSSKSSKAGYQPLAAEQPVRMAVTRRGYADEQDFEKPRRRTTYPARDAAGHYV